MSTENQNNNPEEIDLGVLFKKINDFFGNIALTIFKGILYVKKNIVIFIGLFVVGSVLGYLLDTQTKVYDSNLIVTPNIGSTDYLYSKVDLLTSKLGEGDKEFFKSIGIKNPENIALIEIEPIVDVYSFVNNSTSAASAQNTQNYELLKLLSESSDINKVIKDKITSKNYPNHLIHIVTVNQTSVDETIKPILKFLNTDEYLNKILEISKENIRTKMKKNEELISQTDSLIRILTVNLSKNQTGSALVYNNDNNQFSALFNIKNNSINEIASEKIALINSDDIIKDISTVINIKNNKGTNGKMKKVLPFLFISLFVLYTLFMAFYKKQSAKLNKQL